MSTKNGSYQQLTFWSEEHLASLSALQACEVDWTIPGETSCLPTLESLKVDGLSGLSGKMSPVYCHLTEEKIFLPSSHRWGTWGMGGPTECLTLNGSDSPKDASVCLLSDVLETQQVLPRYYLSAKACAGILRRAEKRGKKLPELLHEALATVVLTTHK